MKRLLLVAGPPGAGKSTLITAFLAGKLPALSEFFHIQPGQCYSLEASKLPDTDWHEIDNLVLHYDFYKQYNGSSYRYLDALFDHFNRVEVLLLETTRMILLWRNSRKLLSTLPGIYKLSRPRYRRNLSAILRKQWLFLRPAAVGNLYRDFLTFLEARSIEAVYPVNTSSFDPDPVRVLQEQQFRASLKQECIYRLANKTG